jgi:hypothetical protein
VIVHLTLGTKQLKAHAIYEKQDLIKSVTKLISENKAYNFDVHVAVHRDKISYNRTN